MKGQMYIEDHSSEEINAFFAKRIVEVLNSALEADRAAITLLIKSHVNCNKTLAEHPSIQVRGYNNGQYSVGPLGVINGLAGTHPNGYGRIAAIFDLACPNGCEPESPSQNEGLKVGDDCPQCGADLTTGGIVKFALTEWAEPDEGGPEPPKAA